MLEIINRPKQFQIDMMLIRINGELPSKLSPLGAGSTFTANENEFLIGLLVQRIEGLTDFMNGIGANPKSQKWKAEKKSLEDEQRLCQTMLQKLSPSIRLMSS